jgi:Rne/Rng family ribonuclease
LLPDRPKTVADFNPDKSVKENLPDTEARLRRKPPTEKLAMPWRKKRKGSPADRVLIDDVLRQGQEILVQVAKEPIGKKGARITSHVALPGRYLVFMPNVEHVGVSRQIESSQERQRLKKIIVDLRGNTKRGFIVRTVGEGASKEDFQRDMEYLTDLWEDIRRKTEKASAPALIHRESSLVHRVIRDHFSDEFRSIVVDDEQEYEGIVNSVNRFNPSLVKRVRLYNKNLPLFDDYGVSADLERALRQKVWLKQGGYIVINQTEALVAIDVNSGRFVGTSNSLEETTTKVNLDAVREIARQVRLRNLGGIIIVDFIDMDVKKNRVKVMESLQVALAEDKTPTKILPFNDFGLIAITRKRVRQSLERILGQPCAYCDGTGVTRSIRTVCYDIYEKLRKMLPNLEGTGEIVIRCHLDVSKFLRSDNKMILREMEDLTSRNISIKTDSAMHIEHFDIVESGAWVDHA